MNKRFDPCWRSIQFDPRQRSNWFYLGQRSTKFNQTRLKIALILSNWKSN